MRTTTKKAGNDTYFEHVREFPLRRIRTVSEHKRANGVFLKLSNAMDKGTTEYLDVLVDLIADYEHRTNQTIDTSGISAAELVRHRMHERAITISALAREIGIPQPNLSEMLNGRRDWSKAAIRSLSKMFSIRAERFLG